MLKKTLTYVDYDGIERTENFYFNLSESEVYEMEVMEEGGYIEKLKRIIAAKDGATIMKAVKEIILKSYGQKSLDGKRFMKSEEISNEFEHSAAYNKLFVELVTNSGAAAAFVNSIFPAPKDNKLPETEAKEDLDKTKAVAEQ